MILLKRIEMTNDVQSYGNFMVIVNKLLEQQASVI